MDRGFGVLSRLMADMKILSTKQGLRLNHAARHIKRADKLRTTVQLIKNETLYMLNRIASDCFL